jgi:hypothetical protein
MDAAAVVSARIDDRSERKRLREERRAARTPLERIVRFAGMITLVAMFGGLSMCGMCVAGAESCGHGGHGGHGGEPTLEADEAEANRAEAEASRAEAEAKRAEAEAKHAEDADPAAEIGGINVELTPSQAKPGKGDVDVKIGSASVHLTGLDIVGDAGPGGMQKVTFTSQRPSADDVKKLIDEKSAQLAECGARGPAPAKLRITLDCDGKFRLDTPIVGPAVACAAGLIGTWTGPHFVGDPITVDVEKPLGKRSQPAK